MLCNNSLVTQCLRQHQHQVSVLTSLNFGITEPFQSFSCGFLRLKECYKYCRRIMKAQCPFSCRCLFDNQWFHNQIFFCFQSNESFNDLSLRHSHLSILNQRKALLLISLATTCSHHVPNLQSKIMLFYHILWVPYSSHKQVNVKENANYLKIIWYFFQPR